MLVIPVYDTLLLPFVEIHVQEDVFSEIELENIQEEEEFLVVPIKKQKDRDQLCQDDFYSVGVLARKTASFSQEEQKLMTVEIGDRVHLGEMSIAPERVEASYDVLQDVQDVSERDEKAFLREFKGYAKDLVENLPAGVMYKGIIRRWKTMHEAATNLGAFLDLDSEERYAILAEDSRNRRFQLIMEGIKRLVGAKSWNEELHRKMSEKEEKAYKVMAIKKQMRVLEQELDHMEEGNASEQEMFAERIAQAGMPEEVEKEAKRVLKRFAMEDGHGSEYGTLYEYLDFITSLSWKEEEGQEIDLAEARNVLEKDHFGLDKVKKRVLEQLAVMRLRGKQTGSILLFAGAPGTGKTSMGQSIARALKRKFVRISLGGVRDEAEIRGHRRTYVGAMPGRIMEGIKRSGVKNPVVVLDEIDKLGQDYKGDPANALLEVLDPEQNHSYVDHFMNVPYDLSNVFFLCTANTLDGIPAPLLDRMEVISLEGYTPTEKYQIGRKYLLPKSLEQVGLKKSQVSVTQGAMKKIISDYTREAGVRGLKKQLDKICRFAAVEVVEKEADKISIKERDLREILGKKVASHDKAGKKNPPGVATGLAWTQAGGEMLFVETVKTKGSGKVHLTGKLGDVMKESAELAYTLVKSDFWDSAVDFEKTDVHIHVPEGAVPKDGPSAGITLYTALSSLMLDKPVKPDLAMTGEVSLQGKVLPIGGLPEKLMAAQRAGIKKVLIPKENEEDLRDVAEEIKEKLEILPVENITQVAREAMGIERQRR